MNSITSIAAALVIFVLAAAAGDCGTVSFAAGEANPVVADRVLVEKAKRQLTLYSRGKEIKTYKIALGRNPLGPKVRQGDGRTPEGVYVVDGRKARSAFHRALHISYPNAADRVRARSLGVSPGGNIMIHGIKNGFGWMGAQHRSLDWTEGCIAVTDEEIEEIWRTVPNGTVVEIVP